MADVRKQRHPAPKPPPNISHEALRAELGHLGHSSGLFHAIEKALFEDKEMSKNTRLIMLAALLSLKETERLRERVGGLEAKLSAVLKDAAEDHAAFRSGKYR